MTGVIIHKAIILRLRLIIIVFVLLVIVSTISIYASNKTIDSFEPDNSRSTARLLKIDSKPEDHMLSRNDQDWFKVMVADGPGFIKISATGAIAFDEFGEDGRGICESEFDAPSPGSKYKITTIILPYELVKGWKLKSYYFQIKNLSNDHVDYQLSIISELPIKEVGAESAEIAAEQYIHAIAEGNLRDLHEVTRKHLSKSQITLLREGLYRRTKSFWLDEKFTYPGREDVDATENKPVQLMIWRSDETKSVYALEVTCHKKDGLWLAISARQDPNMSKEEIAAVIKKAREQEEEIGNGNQTIKKSNNIFTILFITAILVIIILAMLLIALFIRRKK